MKVSDKSLKINWRRDHPITPENFPKYKAAGNRFDRNKIKQLDADGLDTFQIAHVMRMHLDGVKMAMPKKMGKPRNNEAA